MLSASATWPCCRAAARPARIAVRGPSGYPCECGKGPGRARARAPIDLQPSLYFTAKTQMAPPCGTSGYFPGKIRFMRVCIFAGSTPQPDWTAIYCLPSTSNDTGTAATPDPVGNSHRILPVLASKARNMRSLVPPANRRPPPVASTAPQLNDGKLVVQPRRRSLYQLGCRLRRHQRRDQRPLPISSQRFLGLGRNLAPAGPPLIAEPRAAVAGAPEGEVSPGVVGARDPDRGAAAFIVIAARRPGLASGLARRGDRVRLPQVLPGLRIERREEAAHAQFAAGRAEQHLAVDDERRERHVVALFVVIDCRRPCFLAGFGIECDQDRLRCREIDLVTIKT